MSIKVFLNKKGSTIATIGSMFFAVAAVILAVRSAKEGAKNREEYDADMANADGNAQLETEAKIKYVKKTAATYCKAFVAAGGSALLAYISHRTDIKKITELGSALALSEDRISRLYRYIERKFDYAGRNRKEIEKDILESDPNAVFDTPIKARTRRMYRTEAPVTFQDSYSGTLFDTTMANYDAACDRARLILSRRKAYGLAYNKWRSLLGLEDVPIGTNVGWANEEEFTSYLQEAKVDGRVVYVICYRQQPRHNYYI